MKSGGAENALLQNISSKLDIFKHNFIFYSILTTFVNMRYRYIQNVF